MTPDASPSSPGVAAAPLLSSFDALVCDLDGVVYHGVAPIADAVIALQEASESGIRVIYATNNASRTPHDVAAQLAGFELSLADEDVITSSVAGAHVLAAQLPPGARVLAVGGPGVGVALAAEGLTPVTAQASAAAAVAPGEGRSSSPEPAAVLQGYGPEVTAAELAEVAYAVQGGARWVATNTDKTLPTERGMAPGNGSLVGAVRLAVAVEPEVVGKPEPTMYRLAAARLGVAPDRVLAIGDRLETDIEGAKAAGMPSLLVLTGVHGPVDLVRAAPPDRPEYVVSSLASLKEPYIAPTRMGQEWVCGSAVASPTRSPALDPKGLVTDEDATQNASDAAPVFALHLEGDGDERLRVGLAALWEAIDHGSLSVDDAVRVWRSSVAMQSSES